MKKYCFLFGLIFTATSIVKSQSIEEINEMMGKLQFRQAKTAIDKYMQNPKKAEDSEGWYYKGRIYNSLSRDSSVSASEVYDLKNEAFNAFQKNQQYDKKDFYMQMEQYTSYLDLYAGFYDFGAKQFNGKNYEVALNSFKKANEVKDFILNKNYKYDQATLYPIDTSLIMNIAASALQAKKEAEAVSYYKKLTDASVSGPDYKEIYEYMVDYYVKKGDTDSYKPLLEKAKRLYPKSDMWNDIEIKAVSGGGDKKALFAKYEELISQNPSSFLLQYNYAAEMYNSLYGKDATNAGDSILSNKLTSVLKNAIAIETDDITATMLLTNHLYNYSADQLNAANMIKSTKPEDLKNKNAIKASANNSMDECISYAEKAVKYYEDISSKTPIQKANYKIVLGYLSDIYSIKKNRVKADEYDKKNHAADKL